jgi:hypothetical protein
VFVSVRAFIALSKLIYGEHNAISIAPFFILFIFYYWTIGGNSIQYNILISSSFAKAFALWAFYFFLKRRYIMSGILLGIAGNFQLLVGLQLFIIFTGVVVIEKIFLKNTPLKSVLVLSLGYLGLSGWLLLRIIQRQFILPQCDEKNYYDILYIFRNPQHYLPEYFPLYDYLKLILLLAIGTLIIFIVAKKHYASRILLFNTVVVIGIIVYSISIEYPAWKVIGKSQFYKSTIWLQMISSLSISSYFEHKLLHNNKLYYICMIALLGLFFGYHISQKSFIWSLDHRTLALKDLSVMHKYIESNTDIDALFLTFPKDESFICETKRSQYIAFNPIVHESCFMNEWMNRYEHLLQHEIDIKQIGSKGWNYLESQYPMMVNAHYNSFDYILIPKYILPKISVSAHLDKKFETQFYTLYKTK